MFEGFVEAIMEYARINREEGREEAREEERKAVLELVKQGYTAEQIGAKLASNIAGTKTEGAAHV
ncbi:hypothetical protein AGMMS49944_17260 [Spirochaetia bacterium]|nr:hypothetical protein AGMMS49944_17260 [Spirochaetia bacterium]